MTDELKKRPFCGGEAHRDVSKMKHGNVYAIYCECCGCEIARLEASEIIEAWNTRV